MKGVKKWIFSLMKKFGFVTGSNEEYKAMSSFLARVPKPYIMTEEEIFAYDRQLAICRGDDDIPDGFREMVDCLVAVKLRKTPDANEKVFLASFLKQAHSLNDGTDGDEEDASGIL